MQKRKATPKKKPVARTNVGKDYAGPKMEILELMYGALLAVQVNYPSTKQKVKAAVDAYRGWLFSE